MESGWTPRGPEEVDPSEFERGGRRRIPGRDPAEPSLPSEPGRPRTDPYDTDEEIPWDTGEARRRARERGEPFDTAEHRIRRGRRPRHRDLPAKIRRRQDFALAFLSLLVLLIVYLVFFSGGSGGGGGGKESGGISRKRLAGQTIIGRIPDGGVDKTLLKEVRKGQVGGVIVSSDKPGAVDQDAKRLQKAARSGGNPPLLILVDQEGGDVQRLPGPPNLAPSQTKDASTAQGQGKKTGKFLKGVGINVDLAPVVDVAHRQTADTIVTRTYRGDPATVGQLGSAFIQGMQSTDVAATAKHFPGLGYAKQNTDFQAVSVTAAKDLLDADLVPFRDAIDSNVGLVMVSTASYPELGSQKPAAFSPDIIQGLLRGELGYQGVVITDDLETPAVGAGPKAAVVKAIAAGADLALLAQHPGVAQAASKALVKAVKKGVLDQSILQRAYDRIVALKRSIDSGALARSTPTALPAAPTTTATTPTTGATATTTAPAAPTSSTTSSTTQSPGTPSL